MDFHSNVLIETMTMNVVDVLMNLDDDSMTNNSSMDLIVDVFLLNDDNDHRVRNRSIDLFVFSFSNNHCRWTNSVVNVMTNNTNDFDLNLIHHVEKVLMMKTFVETFDRNY